MGRKVAGAVVVALSVGVACSSSSSPPGEDGAAEEGERSEQASRLDPPGDPSVRLVGDGAGAVLEVTFAISPGSEAHLLDLGDTGEPVRVEQDECGGGRCQVVLDRLSLVGVEDITVVGTVGDGRTPPSGSVDLPSWPQVTPAEPDEDGTLELVVVRRDAGADLVVESEEVVPGDDLDARISELERSEEVVGFEVEGPVVDQQAGGDDSVPSMSDHPEGLATWYLEAFDFGRLPPGRPGAGVTVAVIEGAADLSHPVFSDSDGPVDIENVPVRSMGDGVGSPTGHATAVAAKIVGAPGSRAPGVAPGASVRVYDVEQGASQPDVADITAAIIQAVDDGADVINISLARTCNMVGIGDISVRLRCAPGAMRSAVEYAEDHGVVVVAAAGNNGDDSCDAHPNEDVWPAKFPSTIAVGGSTPGGERWVCSPDKDYIDVLAPSQRLQLAYVDSDGEPAYTRGTGTSFAAPLVTGLVAVMLAEDPSLTPDDIRTLLRGAVAENGRLIPGVVLREVGLVPEGVVDPATGQAAHFYSLDLRFRPGHPVQAAARAIEDSWMVPAIPHPEVRGLGPGTWGTTFDDPTVVHLTVSGTLFVDDEGDVTGFGVMETIGADNDRFGNGSGERSEPVEIGHRVRCPAPLGFGSLPHIAFDWTVPAVVEGHLQLDQHRPHLDVTLSLGEGATSEQSGELPGITVHHDDLDRCASFLPTVWEQMMRNSGWTLTPLCMDEPSADACWLRVLRARDDLVDLTEPLYQEIISASPVRFTGDLRGTGDAVSGSLGIGTGDDTWEATLHVGS